MTKSRGAVRSLFALLDVLCAVGAIVLYFAVPESYNVLFGFGFFESFSPLHLCWAFWMIRIVLQFFPDTSKMISSATKQFKKFYIPTGRAPEGEAFERFLKRSSRQALTMLCVWMLCIIGALALFLLELAGSKEMFLLCTLLYVADSICLIKWCPFSALFMKNRCCTTCRIHNWDRLMSFSPLLFVPGFFSVSLMLAATALLCVWEVTFILHPERFWEGSNAALLCKNCKTSNCGKS